MIPAYVEALCKEIEFVGNRVQRESDMNEGITDTHHLFWWWNSFSLIAKTIRIHFQINSNNFTLTDDVEITMEANPGTVSYENLLELRKIGINRISYGVQSANTEELRMLERAHNFFDVIEAVTSARKAGFDNLNLDLIYGLPNRLYQPGKLPLNGFLICILSISRPTR